MGCRYRRSIKLAAGIRNIGDRVVETAGRWRNSTITTTGGDPQGEGLCYESRLGVDRFHQKRLQAEEAREARLTLLESKRIPFKLELSDSGALQLSGLAGQRLNDETIEQALVQHGDYIRAWLLDQADRRSGNSKLIATIYQDTPVPGAPHPVYREEGFFESEPMPVKLAPFPKPPAQPDAPSLFWWDQKIAFLAERKQNSYEQELGQWRLGHEEWLQRCNEIKEANTALEMEWQERQHRWEQRRRDQLELERARYDYFEHSLRHDRDFMERLLLNELNQLDWPWGFEIALQVNVVMGCCEIGVELPEPGAIPAQIVIPEDEKWALSIQTKAEDERQHDYSRYVHGLLLRLAGAVFVTLPAISKLILTGYGRPQGSEVDSTQAESLISVVLPRNRFAELDWDNLNSCNPVKWLDQFELRRNMSSTGHFSVIEPFMNQLAEA